jgi:predicted transcriptional regulator
VPNDLIENSESQKISCMTFLVYVGLKLGSIDDYFNKELGVLSDTLYISRKVIISHIKILEKLGYIKCKFDKFPKHKPLEIESKPIKTNYTILDRQTIYKIIELTKGVQIEIYKSHKIIGEDKLNQMPNKKNENERIIKTIKKNVVTNLVDKGIRYFYILGKNYQKEKNRTFPTYNDIAKNGAISKNYITILNEIFEKNNLMKIEKSKSYLCSSGIKKNRNKYILNIPKYTK